MKSRIWWLASYPKSGNTWLRMFLSAYRNGGRVDINKPFGVLLDDVQAYFHQSVSPLPLRDMTEETQMMLRPAALLSLCAISPPTAPLFVKTHFANCQIAEIPAIPAHLTYGAVYLVRDPRDVAVSFAEHRGEPVDRIISAMARRDHMLRKPPLYQHLASWSEHVKSWTHGTAFPVLAVRYEDVLREPETAFRGVLEFLRHEVDDDLLRASVEAVSFDALKAQEERHGFRERTRSERFFARGAAGGWRDALTKQQAGRIAADHAEMMEAFGYG